MLRYYAWRVLCKVTVTNMATVRTFEVTSDKFKKISVTSVFKAQWNLPKGDEHRNETFLHCKNVPFNTVSIYLFIYFICLFFFLS